LAGVYPSEKQKSRNTRRKTKFKNEKIKNGEIGIFQVFWGVNFEGTSVFELKMRVGVLRWGGWARWARRKRSKTFEKHIETFEKSIETFENIQKKYGNV
jgi:hypothetical protein